MTSLSRDKEFREFWGLPDYKIRPDIEESQFTERPKGDCVKVKCSQCGKYNWGFVREDGAIMVEDGVGNYFNSWVHGCLKCRLSLP